MKCDGCPLQGHKQVAGFGPVHARVAFVGEAPGVDEVARGVPFVGSSGRLLRATIQGAGMEPTMMYYTNVCKCRESKTGTPAEAVVARCATDILPELYQAHADVVVTLGNIATERVLGAIGKISQVRGRVYQAPKYELKVIPTYHPAALLRNPDWFPDFADDIEMALVHPVNVEGKLCDDYTVLDLPNEAIIYLAWLASRDRVAFDIETTSLGVVNNELLSVSFASTNHTARVIPGQLFHDPNVLDALRFATESPTLHWMAHNAQYDVSRFASMLGVRPHISDDTMLMHYALDERTNTHGLKQLAKRFLHVPDWEADIKKYTRKVAKGVSPYGAIPKDVLYRYNANDAVMNFQLYEHLLPKLQAEPTLEKLYRELLIPAANALVDLTIGGCAIDDAQRKALIVSTTEVKQQAARDAQRLMSNPDLNIGSPKQVGQILYTHYGAPDYDHSAPILKDGIPIVTNIRGRSKTTTAKDQLQRLAQAQYSCAPFAQLVIKYREAQQLVSQYLVNFAPESDGRLHPGIQLHTTVTGRLSGSRPNLMNLTRDGPLRGLIVAPSGSVLLAADYSQAEVRTMGALAHSIKLKEIYEAGLDVHDEAGKLLFKDKYVRATHRNVTKGVTFGILYGRSPHSLALSNGMSLEEAVRIHEFILDWLGIRDWIAHAKELMHTQGYVETATGRRRRFPLILPENVADLARQAVNAPVQGTSSDLMLISLMRINALVRDLQAKILFPTHDSILLEVKEGYEQPLVRAVNDIMVVVPEEVLGNFIPFVVDIDVGCSYSKKAMHHYKEWR